MEAKELLDEIKKAGELLDEIKKLNQAYRAGESLVSDAEYDAKIEQLRKIDPNNKWFKHIEPAKVSGKRKAKLPVPMKSLNKVKDIAALNNWCESACLKNDDFIVITPKFDGLSLLHDESNNKSYSRGGSENEGQDCTQHYNAMSATNTRTSYNFTYGEVVFSKKSWTENFSGKCSESGEIYKSPRNTAAGLLNRDIASDKLAYLDFYRYGVDEESLSEHDTYEELYNALCDSYKQKPLLKKIQVKDVTKDVLRELFDEWSQEYYIDGLVIYVNKLSDWKQLGRQGTTGNPNYAIAYKDPNFTDTFITTVKDVAWNVSKAGAFKPVVNISAVDTGDCTMENPTGYNAKYIYGNNIGSGAIIKVTRSGGVIPKILEVIKPCEGKDLEPFTKCPHCGSEVKWNESGVA